MEHGFWKMLKAKKLEKPHEGYPYPPKNECKRTHFFPAARDGRFFGELVLSNSELPRKSHSSQAAGKQQCSDSMRTCRR